jgi:hypothetical protein
MPKGWGRHKAEIERLYVTQGKILKEVQRLLEGRHDFKKFQITSPGLGFVIVGRLTTPERQSSG